MPRGRAAKKLRRDAQATESFFDQAAPSAPTAESSSSQSTQQNKPSAPTQPSGIGYQKFSKFIDNGGPGMPTNKEILDVGIALFSRLRFTDLQAEAEEPPLISESGLNPVKALNWEKEYEKAYRDCANSDDRGRGRNQTARDILGPQSDTKQPPSEKLATMSLKRCILRKDDIMIQLQYLFIRPIQLFNVEKKFGFQREAFAEVMFEDAIESGSMPLTKPPMTLRQIFNSPETLLPEPDDPESRRDRCKNRRRLQNIPDQSNPEVTLEKNCKKVIELLEAHKQAINIIDDKLNKAPTKSWPIASKFRGVDIPRSVPKRIRQYLCDLDYSSTEVEKLVPTMDKLRDEAMRILIFWRCGGDVAWQYGKKEIYGMPKILKYEYNRIDLAASYVIARHNYLRVAKFFKGSKGSLLLTPPLAKALRFDDDRDFEPTKSVWVISTGACHAEKFYTSIDELVTQVDETWETDAQPSRAALEIENSKITKMISDRAARIAAATQGLRGPDL